MGKRSTYITVKPWGTEEIWASTHHSVGKILTIKGGHRLSRKYHRIKNHTIRILEGSLTLEVGPLTPGASVKALTLYPGEVYYLESRTIHRFCADKGGVTVLEISSHGADDSVRLEDDYRRITKIPDRGPHSDK
jgi:mannose-6-phosphate isomerase-like protein (cupin superfamily)